LIVWGNASRRSEDASGAAYDAQANRWRELPPAPVALNLASAVWTGREVVVVGSRLNGSNRAAADGVRGAAYDPASDRWRLIRPYPLSPQASTAARAGGEILVWDYELNAARYDPAADRWRRAPRLPLRPMECYPTSGRLGRRVLAWYCGIGATYDGRTRTWRPIPRRRAAWHGPIPAGRVALFLRAGRVSVYSP
jgi:hypothetical protein